MAAVASWMKTPLARTPEQTGRRFAKPEPVAVDHWTPPQVCGEPGVLLNGQWMATSPKAILIYRFQDGAQVWVPKSLVRSDHVTMAGEAGDVLVPRWWAGKQGWA